ncbi:MAG: hypothetical protein ABI210_02940 [Abditibacteriaceae bacterium]
MKHTWKAGLVVVALAACAGAAKADVTLSGPTGLFLNPTAQVAQKSADVAVEYQRLSQGGNSANLYGIVGAIQLANKLELNGGFRRVSLDGVHANDYNGGLKYQVLNQSEKGFALAVGADYGRTTLNIPSFVDLTFTSYDAYVAGTKDFNSGSGRAPIQGTLGLRWNHLKVDFGGLGSISDSKVDVFAGVAVPLSKTGEFSLIGELGSKRLEGGSSPYSIGVRYHPKASSFNVGAGYARGNTGGILGDSKGLFVQAGYQFGK